MANYDEMLRAVEQFHQPQSDKPEETPANVLRALWSFAAGRPMSVSALGDLPLPPLDTAGTERLRTVLDRKRQGVPLAHITGRQAFLGLELLAGPEAICFR